MYIIENGKGGYIANINNSFTLTGNVNNAKLFDTETKAYNVMRSLPKTVRKNDFFVNSVGEHNAKGTAPIVVSAKNPQEDGEEMQQIKNILSELTEYSKDIIARENELREKQSVIDQELTDIDHYIEFYPLNAYEGYKLAKMRKDRLEERRKVKDGLMEIMVLKNMKVGETLGGLKGIKSQKYTPRCLSEMFAKREKGRASS